MALFSFEKGRHRADLITMYQYVKGSYHEDGDSLLQEVMWKKQEVMVTSYSWGDSG